jgi:hypothetical protein
VNFNDAVGGIVLLRRIRGKHWGFDETEESQGKDQRISGGNRRCKADRTSAAL